ncbi:hypothetical protein EDD11_003300, partial [Mortierella claussenii]
MSSQQHSLSNINGPAQAAGVPGTGVADGSAAGAQFDPRELNIDPTKFRVGGFVGEPVDSQSKVPTDGIVGDVDFSSPFDSNPSPHSNSNANAHDVHPPQSSFGVPSTAESTSDAKSDEEQAKEQSRQKFIEMLHSGQLGIPSEADQHPGRKYTLPVEKPKL